MTDARQRLIRALTDDDLCLCGGQACPTPEQYVDDYAHQLAEQIRNHDYDPGEVGPVHLAYEAAADLIDPEVQR